MDIESLASPLVVVAEVSESLATAARRLWAHEIGALPVFDRGALVGILSERDLVTAMALGGGIDAAVAAYMTPIPATAEPGEDTVAVARRMLDLAFAICRLSMVAGWWAWCRPATCCLSSHGQCGRSPTWRSRPEPSGLRCALGSPSGEAMKCSAGRPAGMSAVRARCACVAGQVCRGLGAAAHL